ncbi:MAG: hypothetical protein ABIA74_05800 [bacterium]
MKRNYFIIPLFFLSFLFSSNIFLSISKSFDAKLVISLDKESGAAVLKQDEYVLSAEVGVSNKDREMLKSTGQKSIEEKLNLVSFNKNVFGGDDQFYLGSNEKLNNASLKQFALTLVTVLFNSDSQKNYVDLQPRAYELVVVNNEIDNNSKDKNYKQSENPVYGQKIEQLTLDESLNPVLSFNRQDVGDNKDPQICALQNDARLLLTHKQNENITDINDASGTNKASNVVGLAASNANVFAAVTPEDETDFGTQDSGFALLRVQTIAGSPETRLSILNADNGIVDGNKALELNLGSDEMIAINTDAKISGFGDMYWDSKLQRLFVVLTGATQDNILNTGGAVSVLVGRIGSNGGLILQPVSGLVENYFKQNDTGNNVVGFYANDNNQYYASGYKVKVMHTSTGYSYLILNGGKEYLDEGDAKNQVYALPIVKSGEEQNIGKLAQKDDFTKIIDAADQLLDVDIDSDFTKAWVGNDYLPLLPTINDVENLFVVGDSVFVCLSGDRNTGEREAGIFKSTALFDNDGKIFSWTGWQRVMGSTDKVFGAGLDNKTVNTNNSNSGNGNFWYLTGDVANKNTVKVTQWGTGDSSDKMLGSFVDFLGKEFVQGYAGVHQIFNFDEKTPGFNAFSMMIATGYKKVVLLETGKVDGTTFNSTTNYADPNVSIIRKDDDVLNQIGPICCSEVSRISTAGNYGWIFVGGFGGLAVLSDNNGDGWNTNIGLNDYQFQNILPGFTLKKIGDFSHIRKLVSDPDNNFLYVVTDESIYKIEMDANNFSAAGAPLVTGTKINLPTSIQGTFISDFMICGNLGLLATIYGLFKTEDLKGTPIIWEEVKINSGIPGIGLTSLGPIQSLSFLSRLRGGDTATGNLYVLAADMSLDLATVYRFYVENDALILIKEDDARHYFYQIGEFRSNFITDGVFGFHMLPKNFGRIGFLKKINISSNVSNFRSSEKTINLDTTENLAYNVGLMVRNTATGAWVVPGDWGIRVQE